VNKNIFKYLRKKILEHSTITEELIGGLRLNKIECLGFVVKVSFSKEFKNKKLVTGLLIDKLVENAEFLKKLEKIETRKKNLKSLLD
jgi:hypothetical protein